jgi:hypothetical protein
MQDVNSSLGIQSLGMFCRNALPAILAAVWRGSSHILWTTPGNFQGLCLTASYSTVLQAQGVKERKHKGSKLPLMCDTKVKKTH